MNTQIVEKIQKLLSLANSDNENEAKLAASKANELLIKHNLSLQQVKDIELSYEEKKLESAGLQLKPHQTYIATIVQKYFFVHAIISRQHVGFSSGRWGNPRTQYEKIIKLVGTPENVEVAGYIFSYLNTAYPRLWKEFKKEHALEKRQEVSYYMGLTTGILEMLEKTKFRVEEETGLVVMKDPKLAEYVKDLTNGKTHGTNGPNHLDRKVYAQGVEDGRNVQLRKPISSDSVNTNLALEHK